MAVETSESTWRIARLGSMVSIACSGGGLMEVAADDDISHCGSLSKPLT